MSVGLFLWVAVVVKTPQCGDPQQTPATHNQGGGACSKQHRVECVFRLPSALCLRLSCLLKILPFPCGWPTHRKFETTILIGKGYARILQQIVRLSSVPHLLCPRFSPEEQPFKRQRKGVMPAAGSGSANGTTAEAPKTVNFRNGFPVKISC